MAKTTDYGLSRNSKKPYSGNNRNKNYTKGYGSQQQRGASQYHNRDNRDNRNTDSKEVTAPYNFVSLNTSILVSALNQYVQNLKNVSSIQKEFARYVRNEGKYSGYILLDVETLTPLYIEKDGKAFSDGKNLCIPGSSMRGAIKNLFKIVTNSSMRSEYKAHDSDVTDRRLYFRSFASGSDEFRKLYTDRVNPDGNGRQTKAGFLVRKGEDEYIIYEADYDSVSTETAEDANWPVPGKTDKNGKPIYKPHITWDPDDKTDNETDDEYVVVKTGPFINKEGDEDNSKKHYYRIYKPKWDKKHSVSKRIVEEYKKDKSRGRLDLINERGGEKAGLFKKEVLRRNIKVLIGSKDSKIVMPDFDYIVPCFYIEEGNEITGFGAGPYFRIPYIKSISDHIPKAINQKTIVDYADAVFGSKENWSSRVFFEDLYLKSDSGDNLLRPASQVKILEGPKPTSFQNYLMPVATEDGSFKASTWESESAIRGYKLYWHHENDRDADWKAQKNVPPSYQHLIEPVKAGKHFSGKLRFESLTKVELGALLFVLGLGNEQKPEINTQEEMYVTFKIGMGKPIGLGSVAVTSRLFIAPDDYYTSLFNADEQDCFNLPKTLQSNESGGSFYAQDCVTAFIDEMKNSGNYNADYLHRISELKIILDATYRNQMTVKTRYLDVNNKNDKRLLNQRKPLPGITEVNNSLKK